jgi:hypothetical protein
MLNLSDMTSKFPVVAMFVIVGLKQYSYKNCRNVYNFFI